MLQPAQSAALIASPEVSRSDFNLFNWNQIKGLLTPKAVRPDALWKDQRDIEFDGHTLEGTWDDTEWSRVARIVRTGGID